MSTPKPERKPERPQRALWPPSASPVLMERAALVAIFLVATFFRVHLFEAAPPGLQHDEAFKANFAQEILAGRWPVFFDANGGEEALFPYLAALSILLVGHNFVALRLVSFVCGMLSLALGYSLARVLFNRRVALLSAALLSVSFWHIFDTRVALRPITLLMMGLASFYLFWLGLRHGKIRLFALCGLFMGGSLHTYTSGFLIPLTVIVYALLYLLPFERRLLLDRWRGILLAFAIALVLFAPLAYHVQTHPVASTARARDLGDHLALLFQGDPGPIARDVLNVLGMFGLRGDPEWRYNLAGRPVFDLLTFALFCGGLIISVRRIRKPEYAFLLLWLVINIVPSAVTRHSPSTLRAIGSLTAIYILPALTLDFAWPQVRDRFGVPGGRLLGLGVASLLVCTAVFTYRDYFTIWARNSEVRDIYRGDLTAVAHFIEGLDGDEVVCVSASFAADLDQQVLNLMVGERKPIRWFDGRQAFVLPNVHSSQDVVYAIPATGSLREELRAAYLSDLPVHESVLDPSGEPAFVAYRVNPEELSHLRGMAPSRSLSANLGDRVELLGYELSSPVQAGNDVLMLLYWRVPQPIRPDLQFSFFAHLVDMRGYVWDQVDTLGYPVSNWIEGDLVIQLFELRVPRDAPPLDYQVKLGMYDEITGVRLTAKVEDVVDPEGAVSIEPFSIQMAPMAADDVEMEIPRERYADFEGVLTLLGCDVGAVAVERGEPVHISLYWQATSKPETDYQVSILITEEEGAVLAELFRKPVDGLYPTSLWVQGQMVRDRFDLVMDPSLPEGRHRLWVRLWDPTEGRYLQVIGSEDDKVRLGKVYVGP